MPLARCQVREARPIGQDRPMASPEPFAPLALEAAGAPTFELDDLITSAAEPDA
jgi:hypothetical protein